jgi:3-phenylpropionate/trans-cinnamate dioxygenase ferredoxin subunit
MTYNQLDPEKCEFLAVATVDELPDGQRLYLEIGDLYLIVFNIADKYFAIADLCSHDEEPLDAGELDGHAVVCPRHGARFDVRTGQALTPPAVEPIPAYPVRVRNGSIEVGLLKE